ncbi:hypothetical protein CEUSTIGMA_g731.t1 [Chlamydomonas eustigma]|uniref:Uncharacterized protein n=1 Tax=Chlamydomonas eustigma TaxID=1157962 RepID=A0A250WR12_9CHLO|nr:hypothetical protein CEUSTIGMA_g731.t1 [Chlamydomonas eustigma]|eukprot:GAX73277.1 hypothetical protein CEUSTIGMA_g731.t1 [Chlamydomonas eustigma]
MTACCSHYTYQMIACCSHCSYQMLISFPLDVGNTNVNKQSVTQEVCPALLGLLSNLLQDQGLSPFTTLYGSIQANGCYAVSILPSPVAPIRIQATYFNVTAPQWSSLTAALYSINTITRGHILCYSTLTLKPYGSVSASEAAKSTLMMTPTANPGWLGTPAEAAGTCFTSLRPASPQ